MVVVDGGSIDPPPDGGVDGGSPDAVAVSDLGAAPDIGGPDLGVDGPPSVRPISVDFGAVRVESTKVLAVTVSTARARTLEMSLESSNSSFQLVANQVSIGANETFQVPIVFRPTEEGEETTQLLIESCGGACPLRVPLRAVGVAQGIRCSDLDAGAIPTGTCVERALQCTNLTAQEPVFNGGNFGGPGRVLSDQLVVPASQDFEVELEVCAPGVGPIESLVTTDFRFPGNVDELQVARVQVEGRDAMPMSCQLDVSPASLDFGPVNLMSTEVEIVQLTNRGTANCQLGAIQVQGLNSGDFASTIPGAAPIPPGRSASLTVRFTPTQTGPREATLNISSNDPNRPVVTVEVQGSGQSGTVTGYRIQTSSGLPSLPPGRALTFSNNDDGSAREPLPFAFEFLGTSVSEVFVSTNGFLTFDSRSAGSLTNRAIPSGNNPNRLVAWFWDDLILDIPGSEVTVSLQGTSPNRRMIFVFRRIRRFGGGGVGNADTELFAQVELHETSHEVAVHYGQAISRTAASNFDASAGWENETGSAGADVLMCSPSCTLANWPTNTRYRYIPN
ncbi:MAG: choice-of-anchor D domain-containing protein [Myxococcota bacterium]